jgi:hypothetical protein
MNMPHYTLMHEQMRPYRSKERIHANLKTYKSHQSATIKPPHHHPNPTQPLPNTLRTTYKHDIRQN